MPDDQTIAPIIARQRSLAIKGLTPRLPERGRIKIGKKGAVKKSQGGKEFQMPVKLDHFVVTTLEKDEDGNFKQDDEIHKFLGAEPTEIPIRLLYDDVALNFPTRYAAYQGRSLWCSGDGEIAQRLRNDKKGYEPFQCPCPLQAQDYDGPTKCKMNGNLSVLVEGAGGVGGVWTFRTTSYNSVVGLISSMTFIKSVTGGVLANIPLTLAVRPKVATAPNGQSQTIYVVSLEFSGTRDQLLEIGHDIALHRAKTHLSITHIEDEARRLLMLAPPVNAPLPGDEAADIVDEFYPEEAANAPARPTRADFADTPAQSEPQGDDLLPTDGFDAVLFEAGFLSQIEAATTSEACVRLIQANLEDLRRLDGDKCKELTRKANARAEELGPPKQAAAKGQPTKYCTCDENGEIAVEHIRPRDWCDEVIAILGSMPVADRLRYWQANEPTFNQIKSDFIGMEGERGTKVREFLASLETEIKELLAGADQTPDPFGLGEKAE